MIYFVQEERANGLIKIGYTNMLIQRIDVLRRESEYPLKLLAAMDGNMRTERVLHKQFSSIRIRGEWFYPASELLEAIAEINKSGIVFGVLEEDGQTFAGTATSISDWVENYFDNQTDAAACLGIDQTHLSRILSKKRQISARLAVVIETKAGIPRESLRPDIFQPVRVHA